MNAVGEVDVQLFTFRPFHHFVHRSRAEMLARIAKLLHATMVTNIRIADHQVDRLVILMTRA